MSRILKVDVVVVGAGSAGAAVAALCARRGMLVVCLEARPLDQAGARWVNGIPLWMFEAAGIPLPGDGEAVGRPSAYHMVAGWGQSGVTVPAEGMVEVDMGRLVARLQRAARAAGALLFAENPIARWDGVHVHTPHRVFEPRWVVDASGLDGARLLGQPRPRPEDLCVAAQAIHAVRRPAEGLAFLRRYNAAEEQHICFLGVAGGFSIVSLRLERDRVFLLAGSVPASGHPPGTELLDRFISEHRWIGPRLFGGSRAIPLRRPYDCIARDRVALVGDAACQVFSPHASGTGQGLLAARMLAEALAEGRGAEGYATTYMRSLGGLLASFEIFRRLTQDLSLQELKRMMDACIITPRVVRLGLVQSGKIPGARTLTGLLPGTLREPRLALRLARAAGRMLLARGLYATYPSDPALLWRWTGRLRHAGLAADPTPDLS